MIFAWPERLYAPGDAAGHAGDGGDTVKDVASADQPAIAPPAAMRQRWPWMTLLVAVLAVMTFSAEQAVIWAAASWPWLDYLAWLRWYDDSVLQRPWQWWTNALVAPSAVMTVLGLALWIVMASACERRWGSAWLIGILAVLLPLGVLPAAWLGHGYSSGGLAAVTLALVAALAEWRSGMTWQGRWWWWWWRAMGVGRWHLPLWQVVAWGWLVLVACELWWATSGHALAGSLAVTIQILAGQGLGRIMDLLERDR